MMALMAFDRILVVDGDDIFLFIGNEDGLCATLDAFLGAGLAAGVGAFNAALLVNDPAGHGVIGGPRGDCEQKHEGCYQGEQFFHCHPLFTAA
jgi:hypothetical protein